jgi:hypothetical protein
MSKKKPKPPKPFLELNSDATPEIHKCEDGDFRSTWRGFQTVVSAWFEK